MSLLELLGYIVPPGLFLYFFRSYSREALHRGVVQIIVAIEATAMCVALAANTLVVLDESEETARIILVGAVAVQLTPYVASFAYGLSRRGE